MSPQIAGVIGLVVLFLFIFLGTPIAIAMALIGWAGCCYFTDVLAGTGMLSTSMFNTIFSYVLAVLPLFILMGEFASVSGLTEEIYRAVNKWLGHLPGGLAIVTIGACAGFSAVCGSSLATAATIGKVALPEMRKHGYDSGLATGTVAAGGTLGILIPPSTAFILYALMCQQSVSELFMAGILPGLLLTALLMLTIYIQVRLKPSLGPPFGKASWRERLGTAKDIWATMTLFLIVMGGIWGGIFTPTEGAGIGTTTAFIFILIKRRFSKKAVIESLSNTAIATGMVFLLVIGAMIFNYFMALSQLPTEMAKFVASLTLDRYGVLTVVIILYLFLGCIMETLSMLLLTVPIIYPAIMALGFDPIWFGVIIVLLTEVALITPPIGMNVFVIAGIARDVPTERIFRGIFPFLITLCVALALLIAFPQVALFLPGTMRK